MSIRRCVSGHHLSCGCVAGVYETYGNEIVTIIDVKSERCGDASHVEGNVVPARPALASPDASHAAPPD